jgi:hypothetical protein
MFPEIYNYLGSYKAVINSINYFGYEDLEFYEYYLNIDKESKRYNKLEKIEIPDIFNNQVEGWTENDYIKGTLPNSRYQKTKLFNLTYRITDKEGEYILAYSLDEIITKLLGLKKWLRNNVMPIGTRLKDLTGRGDTVGTTEIWHGMKMSTKFNITEELTLVDFNVEAYRQPVENNSKTYNLHIDFETSGTNFLPDYYQVNIYTFAAYPDLSNSNFKLKSIQRLSYYKTDFESINFAADRETDPFIYIETIMDNNYGAGYTHKKTYSLELAAFV